MLAVVTGPVRSGKSSVALDLAMQTGRDVVLAAGGRPCDEEMARRIARHRMERPASVQVLEVDSGSKWVESVSEESCLVVECLGTVLSGSLDKLVPEGARFASPQAEQEAQDIASALVEALIGRSGDTVVVGNEVGWGLVSPHPLGRLFCDVMGRAMRGLVDAADVALLVVAGRCIDLASLPKEGHWPKRGGR